MNDQPVTPASTAEVEQITPYLFREWAYDRQIVIYTVRDISRDTVETWVKSLQDTLETWPAGQPFLALFDLNFLEASLTPLIRDRLGGVMDSQHDLKGRSVLLMRKGFLVNLARLYLRNRRPGTRQRQIFFSRDEGLAWLAQELDKQD
jgi:hypothetical protein